MRATIRHAAPPTPAEIGAAMGASASYGGRVRTEFVTANGIRFHLETDGDGPLILLLHGFPQTSYQWHHVLPMLASHGYRVVAPDLRGIGESSRPTRVKDYRLSVLGDDVAALIRALGEERAHVIGHDWGGIIAWEVGFSHPEAVDRLVIVNAPPAPAMVRTLLTSLRQLGRSWYIFFFNLPFLPERFLTGGHSRIMPRLLEPGHFSAEEIQVYADAICRPRAAWAGLAYYRAASRAVFADLRRVRHKKVASPTLVIWGEPDPALGKELTQHLNRYVSGPLQIQYVPDAGHWVIQDFPERFVELVAGFLAEDRAS
jgi:pimeloyl-ACP methyl ester carboxylesterase